MALGVRTGVAEEVAYLRPRYPASEWRSHENFGELANFWLQVHASLRSEGSQVVRIVDAFRGQEIDGMQLQQAFVPQLNSFLQHLDHHHRIEDHVYFPKFRQLDGRLIVGFDLLEADHELIHESLVQTVEHARELLVALSQTFGEERQAADIFADRIGHLLRLLQQHLADEEDLVVPALLEYGEQAL
ncbi:hemerythrin domain-containing protein [Sphingomonas glaciei]|uniref:Hemerythrin domain-containing protein n=1 Tax=Sphingomonas glaciei TaxID=2938948 RepID=A0ABY5N0X4_9SPHN|nr:hemerythrin domain-containing protein [Sphingomonas glaciei]UUR09379.1 hemerythrin domain-containing protein [Sphingomonas glaciei]